MLDQAPRQMAMPNLHFRLFAEQKRVHSDRIISSDKARNLYGNPDRVAKKHMNISPRTKIGLEKLRFRISGRFPA